MKNRIFLQGWLRGFWDGEGCVSFLRKEDGHKQTYCRLYVGNTDKTLIDECAAALKALDIGFSYRLRKSIPPRKRLGLIYIQRHDDLIKFSKLVGFASSSKSQAMNDIVEYINSRGPKYSKTLMTNLYVKQKMSLPDICRHFGKHKKQQWYFSKLLKDYGISTRSRSEAIKLGLAKSVRKQSASVALTS